MYPTRLALGSSPHPSHVSLPPTLQYSGRGDLNLPDCDWKSVQVANKCKYPEHYTKLFNIVDDFGLTQHVTEITRIDAVYGTENTLDLIMSNRPNSIISSSVLPGISDHDHPQIELDVQPVCNIKNQGMYPCTRRRTGMSSVYL